MQSLHDTAELSCCDYFAKRLCWEASEPGFYVQGKLSQTERALAAARAGLESAAAQTSELTEELGAERKRAGALTNDVKRAGTASLLRPCRSFSCKVLKTDANA